jgi:hypothetical protein
MRIYLPLNKMLALIARGLCDSQAIIIFLEMCVMVASLVSSGGCSRDVGI